MKPSVEIDVNKPLGGPEWRAYLELRMTAGGAATLSTGEKHSSDNGTPMDEWNAITLAWRSYLSQGCEALPHLDLVADIAEQAAPLLDRVAVGHTVDWNGSNYAGRLTDDAQDASYELDRLVSECSWTRE